MFILLKLVVYKCRFLWYNSHVRKHHIMTKREKKKQKEKEMLKGDIQSMEQSIEFHTKRIETFGKPNPKGPMHANPYDNVNPKNLLPYLNKALQAMQADFKKA